MVGGMPTWGGQEVGGQTGLSWGPALPLDTRSYLPRGGLRGPAGGLCVCGRGPELPALLQQQGACASPLGAPEKTQNTAGVHI